MHNVFNGDEADESKSKKREGKSLHKVFRNNCDPAQCRSQVDSLGTALLFHRGIQWAPKPLQCLVVLHWG